MADNMTSFAKTMQALTGWGQFDAEELREKYFDEHSELVELDGIKFHYRREGSGQPLVLIHGILSSLHTWDGWVDRLAKNFTIYRFDLPGFGFSTLPAAREIYTKECLIDLLAGLFETLGLSEFHIAGNSLGGYISWNYALENADQIKTLTVIDPLCYPGKIPFLLELPTFPVAGVLTGLAVPKPIFDVGVDQVYAHPERIPSSTKQRYFDLLMSNGNKTHLVAVSRSLRDIVLDPDLGEDIKKINVPTLVMWGERDRWIPVEMAHRWQRDLPSAQVITYPDVGHVPMEEAPEVTANDFGIFVEQTSMGS